MNLTRLFLGLLFLMTAQAVGTYMQVQQYKQAVRRLHRLGNVGIGSKKGRFVPGNIVVIACNRDGVITAGEIMEGYTIFNRFKEIRGIIGKTIYDLLAEYGSLPEKKQRMYKAHIQALDALNLRLNPDKL
ncbi:glucitol operon activator [Lucifera butyrica]|uniref:Glucitol operon activator n=1 Tax=Lucifera butyrica TaxID=1351585 RepID=A0A498R7X7_9FIRM|nr:transcriptional regulator GutM [Lucifera butyrica]VBB07289.1 glucitol operon activator [Lucifera butyrica]